MNILIIEDEPPIMREIISTIRNISSSYVIIAKAQNGKEALDQLERYHNDIDVVITDINLPIMNGLDIIEHSKAEYPDIPFIVLSGYDDFSYAKKAIQLSAIDYLLKPIEANELDLVLKKTWEKICVNKFVPKMISQTPNKESNTYFLAILCIDSYIEDATASNNDAHNTSYYTAHFQKKLCNILSEQNFWLIDGSSSYEKFLIISLDNQQYLHNTMHRIFSSLQIAGHNLTIIVNSTAISIENIYSYNQSLRETLKQVLILEKAQLLFTPCKTISYDSVYFYKEITRLSNLYSSGNYSLFLTNLKDLIHEFKNHNLSLENVIQLINLLFSTCRTSALKDGMTFSELGSLSTDVFSYSYNYLDLYNNLKSIFELIFNETKASSSEARDIQLSKLDAYINAHFREPLNTQDLCSIFNFTPAYVSKIYKDYKGISPSSYITQLRMEEALKLLKENNINIRDLSTYLGYDDSFYFSKLFKKIYGVSPKQYQKNPSIIH